MATDGSAESLPSGEYQVVARRYRPQSFEELIGQQHVARALSNAISSHRVGHAYLFTGARGVGKTSTARILAKALDCVHGPTPTPCNQCDICQSISAGGDVDVLEIDGASNRGIDEIRQLRQNVNIRPSRARFKIYIIDEVHMLTREAFNALLKTLEEPPEHVKFIFCTTEANKIPITILSRCQRFDFAGIRTGAIVDRLSQIVAAEGITAEPAALEMLARRANGSMRDSQSLLEQLLSFGEKHLTLADVNSLLGTANDARLITLLKCLVDRTAGAALVEVDAALREGVDVGQLLEQLLGYLRDCMAAAVGCSPDAYLYASQEAQPEIARAAQGLGLQTILAMVQIVEQTLARLRYSTQGRTLLEIALVRLCALEDLDELAEVAAAVASGSPVAAPQKKSEPLAAVPPQAAAAPVSAAMATAPAVSVPATVSAPATTVAAPVVATASVEPTPAPGMPVAAAQPVTAAEPLPATHLQATDSPASAAPAAQATAAQSTAAQAAATQPVPADVTPDSAAAPVPASPTPSPAAPHTLTPEALLNIWRQVAQSRSGLLADFALHAQSIAISAPNKLAISFPGRYNHSKLFCERPEQLAELEQAVAEATGSFWRLEFILLAEEKQAPAPKRSTSRPSLEDRQRTLALAEHPLVQRAKELFGAEVVRVDTGS